MRERIKRNIFIFLLVIIFAISFCIRRYRIYDNELYVKLLSEEIYLLFIKQKISRDIVKEYNRLRKKSRIRYVEGCSDYLLYTNESNVFRIIMFNNEHIINKLYKPKFQYEVDGNYVHFIFEDIYLNHVDGIMINFITNNKEKMLYYIPVNTNNFKYESIVRIDKINIYNQKEIDFEIKYTHRLIDNE